MPMPVAQERSAERRAQDEQIASEPRLPPPDLPAGTAPLPVEAHLARRARPLAVAGVVENGMVRLLDPGVKLRERTRVIVVAADGG